MTSGRPRRQAMCSTNLVLPQPVGPLSMSGQPPRVAHLEDGDLVSRGEIERRVGSRVAETVVPASIRHVAERGLLPGRCGRSCGRRRRLGRRVPLNALPRREEEEVPEKQRHAGRRTASRSRRASGSAPESSTASRDIRSRGPARDRPGRCRRPQAPWSCQTCRRPAARRPRARLLIHAAIRGAPSATASRR